MREEFLLALRHQSPSRVRYRTFAGGCQGRRRSSWTQNGRVLRGDSKITTPEKSAPAVSIVASDSGARQCRQQDGCKDRRNAQHHEQFRKRYTRFSASPHGTCPLATMRGCRIRRADARHGRAALPTRPTPRPASLPPAGQSLLEVSSGRTVLYLSAIVKRFFLPYFSLFWRNPSISRNGPIPQNRPIR